MLRVVFRSLHWHTPHTVTMPFHVHAEQGYERIATRTILQNFLREVRPSICPARASSTCEKEPRTPVGTTLLAPRTACTM
jgi:hypothetical protein